MSELAGKVAIVTGAGRGIGRGIAMRYGAEGVNVVVASRTKARLDGVVEEIREAGGAAIGIQCDIGYRDQIQAMVSRAFDAFGPVDILVNAAQGFGTESSPAGSPVVTPLEDYREAEWEYTMRTGASATLWAMQAAFPHMKGSGGGRIINFGSGYGVNGQPGAAAYNAAKEAIRALTRTAAREWGQHNITVNCINPVVMSDSVMSVFDGDLQKANETLSRVPLRRWGDAYDDAGGLAVFLAQESASFITGMTFWLDGGMNARA
jgi:NAD(P)-dependent dehydrogenase (short-subunit alcohol dehydrogenase family)